MTLLGISIGTRTTGTVLLIDGRLRDWHNHTFLGKWSNKKCKRMIERYEKHIKKYGVRIIIAKIPPQTHQTKRINQIIESLDEVVKKHKCFVHYKTKRDLKHVFPTALNPHELAQEAASQFPDLLPLMEREFRNKRPYYLKVFEAALIAAAHDK